MSEQQHSAVAPIHENQPEAVGRLRAAIDKVISSPASSTSTAVNALNAVLRSKSLEAADRAERGTLLVKLLSEPMIKRAVDDSGTSTRALAVGALLELGYPFALQVHPDDLAFFRKSQRPPVRFRRFAVATVALGALLGSIGYLGTRAERIDVGDAGPRALAQCQRAELTPERYEQTIERARKRMSAAAIEQTLLEMDRVGTRDPARSKLMCDLFIPQEW